jgi:hypothetical protein
VLKQGSVFFMRKQTLKNGVWTDPVVLTKGKDADFEKAWLEWRVKVQDHFSSALAVTVANLWCVYVCDAEGILLHLMHSACENACELLIGIAL